MNVVHISDMHFGNEDRPALDAAAGYIDDVKPDLVIASGDLTAVGSEREMIAAFDWLRGLSAPALAVPGNHDTPYFDLIPRVLDPFGHFHRACWGVETRALVRDDLVVVPVNTARGVQFRKNWALGAISRSQIANAAETLRSAPPDALKLVVTHHPLAWPAASPIKGTTRRGAKALRALIEAGADLFLSGHLHATDVRPIALAGRHAAAISAGTLSIRHRGEPGGFIAIRRKSPDRLEIERLYAVGNHAESGGITTLELTHAPAGVHAAIEETV
ncbi:MAG: metallophosphoesterase [Hyphomonadaceae bacterium]